MPRGRRYGREDEIRREFDAELRTQTQPALESTSGRVGANRYAQKNITLNTASLSSNIDDLDFLQGTRKTSGFAWIWIVLFVIAGIVAVMSVFF